MVFCLTATRIIKTGQEYGSATSEKQCAGGCPLLCCKSLIIKKRTDAETLLNSSTPSGRLRKYLRREEPFDILAHFEAFLPHF